MSTCLTEKSLQRYETVFITPVYRISVFVKVVLSKGIATIDLHSKHVKTIKGQMKHVSVKAVVSTCSCQRL